MAAKDKKAENRIIIRPGARVRVRTWPEIKKTLDGSGCTDGLVFMEEMCQYCGGVYEILQCVSRIVVEGHGMREMPDTFILKDLRCSGTPQKTCDRLCYILWKSAWLDLYTAEEPDANEYARDKTGMEYSTIHCQGQAPALMRATRPLPFFNLRPYLNDRRSGTRSLPGSFKLLSTSCRKWARRNLSQVYRRVSWRGMANSFQSRPLLIKPGDMVQVLDKKDIAKTLDINGKLKGLSFNPEMWNYCGQNFRVIKEIKHFVYEEKGTLLKTSDTFLLEGVICDGTAFRGCPRGCYWYWKGAWLKPVETP